MLGWLVLGAAVLAMYRIADAENRSGLAWGALTFAICFACMIAMPMLPLINIGIGLFLSFMMMMVLKMVASRQ